MRLFLSIIVLFFASPAFALTVDKPLVSAEQEVQAKALFKEIRCVVCQSETIADSPSDIATDMRKLIRERVAAGDSSEAIKTYLTSRYGDVILMKPPLKQSTALLWFGPSMILLFAVWFALRFFRKQRA